MSINFFKTTTILALLLLTLNNVDNTFFKTLKTLILMSFMVCVEI